MKPRRPKPEYALASAARAYVEEFKFPQVDQYIPPGVPGGGGGAPTVVVAASDASALSKSKADLVCLGADDHLTIQAALDMTVAAGGGRVLLTEGTFNVDTNGILVGASNVVCTLQGMGTEATIVKTLNSTGVVVCLEDFARVCDFTIWGNSTEAAIGGSQFDIGIGTGGNDCTIDNVLAFNNDEMLRLSGNRWLITRCRPYATTTYFVRDLDLYENTLIYNNVIIAGGLDMGDGTDWAIVGNKIAASILADNPERFIIAGNTWGDDSSVFNTALIEIATSGIHGVIADNICGSVGFDFVHLTGVTATQITGNMAALADNGFVFNNCDRLTITNNLIEFPGEHGFWLNNTNNSVVTGNHAYWPGSNTNNTYDGFVIDGDDNSVVGNHVTPAASSPLTRYGLNVVAGGSNNAVYANYLGDSSDYGTADSVDAGTATQTTPAAGAIGGQFAY